MSLPEIASDAQIQRGKQVDAHDGLRCRLNRLKRGCSPAGGPQVRVACAYEHAKPAAAAELEAGLNVHVIELILRRGRRNLRPSAVAASDSQSRREHPVE